MNKVVLVTGAVKNSGLAIARRFAREGFAVCVTSRNGANAERTAEDLTGEFGVPARGFALDLENPADIDRVFDEVKSAFGRLDVFVGNSANLGLGQSVLEIAPEDFESVLRVNVTGNFHCCQRAAKLMLEKGGSIVLVGSVHGRGAVRGRVAYAASKGAVSSLVKNLSYELAQYKIRVNEVVPGAIRTDRWEGLTPEEVAARRARWPLGIESTGEDIANAVWFLASDQAKTTTGASLAVDSGVLTCLLQYEKEQ